MTNFDFLKKEEKFNIFADVAIAAEKTIRVDLGSCVINCRRAMEFAIKWIFSVDESLEMPYRDNLATLMQDDGFQELVGDYSLLKRLEFIRRTGNDVAHKNRKVKVQEAILCLENLHYFMDFVCCCYSDNYTYVPFDRELLKKKKTKPLVQESHFPEVDLQALLAENKALREELSNRREEQKQNYVSKPVELSEYATRKLYIDAMLREAGWIEGKNWINEVEIKGMPNASQTGRADYVLYDDAMKPLAIIEAKSTCKDPAAGRKQAQLYADNLAKQYGRRPVIFLSNGFDTRIDDGQYPERRISTFYSKRDLEKWFNLRLMRSSLKYVSVDKNIAGRYYQEAAIKAVCDAFDQKNKRKALLVMATGSGKTRTVIALTDILLNNGWVKNILFLADRTSLVTQAKRSFADLLPNFSISNICGKDANYQAHGIFATYQTMINCIDSIHDEEGKIFTSGHFDLIICDEAHRSIYNKYRDIFRYFDAPLVGLTATPKEDIGTNTYEEFELEDGVPTYGYELAQAVKDGYLVNYTSIETKLKFVEEGIHYDELSEEEREDYEKKFIKEDGSMPDAIASSAINKWLFNKDTIKKVLHTLMTEGIHIDYGQKIGKTIIFAKNHKHAEEIYKIFNEEYPNLKDYAMVIDNYSSYVQKSIDDFSDPKKMPQIAISVDMLDTGIDVPEVVNLVFFKKVMSKAKFWQMIGRGTRLCEKLIDGKDKNIFYIFDFCSNFEFFRENDNKGRAETRMALQGAIYNLEFQLAYKLQDLEYQTERLMEYRKALVEHMQGKVTELKRDNFAVQQHIKYVDLYSKIDNYNHLEFEDTLVVKEEIAPLLIPDQDEVTALRFDALMYGLELAKVSGASMSRAFKDIREKADYLSKKVGNMPDVQAHSEIIQKILKTPYLEEAEIGDFEQVRVELRHLMKYIKKEYGEYHTSYEDSILSVEWKESELENDDLRNYKEKAEYYIRQNQENEVIAKLKNNQPLSDDDVEELEKILWKEVGTKEDYEGEYGEKPLGEFVREIVGLDMNAAKEAFSEYLDETNMDSRQIYFVNQIVEYIVHNGMLKDFTVLQETPFSDQGSIVDIFEDNLQIWLGIRSVIESINANALAA